VDIDINSRLAKAGDAFGKPLRRLWGKHSRIANEDRRLPSIGVVHVAVRV